MLLIPKKLIQKFAKRSGKIRSIANHLAKKTAALSVNWNKKPQHCQSFGKKNRSTLNELEKTAALPIIWQKKPQHSQWIGKKTAALQIIWQKNPQHSQWIGKNRSAANDLAKKTAALLMNWKNKPQHCQSFGKKNAALSVNWNKKPQHCQSFGKKKTQHSQWIKPQHFQSFGKKNAALSELDKAALPIIQRISNEFQSFKWFRSPTKNIKKLLTWRIWILNHPERYHDPCEIQDRES